VLGETCLCGIDYVWGMIMLRKIFLLSFLAIIFSSCCHPDYQLIVSIDNQSSFSFYVEQWDTGRTDLSRGYHKVTYLKEGFAIYIYEGSIGGEMSDCDFVLSRTDSVVLDVEQDSIKYKLNFDINNCDRWKYSETHEGRCGTTRGRYYITIEDSDFVEVD
jgi:hypothetical protein